MFNSNTKVPVIDDETFQFIKFAVLDKLTLIRDKAIADLKDAQKATADYDGPNSDIVFMALDSLIDSCNLKITNSNAMKEKVIVWLDYYKSPPTVRAYTTNNTVISPRNE